MTDIQTPVSYYGGKQKMIYHIVPLMPKHQVYTEAFFGGGTVYWAKPSVENETINDRLDYVVNFYQILKSRFDELKVMIDSSLMSRTLHKRAMAAMKADQIDPVERAWAFWYVTNFSFAHKIGGGLKYGRDPKTVEADILHRKKERFTEALQKRIEHTYIENIDGIEVIKKRDCKAAFHYVDPPCPGSQQGHYSGYGWDEYEDLLKALSKTKGKFMLSNYPSELLDKYIRDNGWKARVVKREIRLSQGKSDKVKSEMMVMNYNPAPVLFELPPDSLMG